jgi:hypothetical protein
MRNIIFASTVGLWALCFIACGGSKKDPVSATVLSYTDPTGGGYRVVKGAATGRTIVFELRGPASTLGRGITFTVETDPIKASFVKVDQSETEIAQNGYAFQLGSEPRLFKSVAEDGTLRVSLAQKGQGNAQNLDNVLARFALQLNSGVTQGEQITLRVTEAKILPETGASQYITTVTCGVLMAQ